MWLTTVPAPNHHIVTRFFSNALSFSQGNGPEAELAANALVLCSFQLDSNKFTSSYSTDQAVATVDCQASLQVAYRYHDLDMHLS